MTKLFLYVRYVALNSEDSESLVLVCELVTAIITLGVDLKVLEMM